MNNDLEIGGLGEDVELDEIAFRFKTVGDVWIRFLAIASRESSFVFLTRLPYRVTQSGQGGGGSIFLQVSWPTHVCDTSLPARNSASDWR